MNYKSIKGLIGFFLLVVFISLCQCSKVNELLTFFISDQTTLRIENTAPVNLPFEVPTPEISTNSNQKFENNHTSANLVKDIKLNELRLTITNPVNKTFSFLKSIQVYISTTQNDEILLAHHDNVPADVSMIALITTQEKLDHYIKSDSYKLRTKIITRETFTQAIDVQVDLKFKVTASGL
jgi:hypothetical protein